MKMEAPLEIGIAVRDLAGMTAFYVDVLGCTKVSEVTVPPDKSRANGLSPDGATVVRVQTPYGERIKLLAAPSTTTGGPGEWLLARAGLAYVTFIIRGIDDWYARLKARGIRVASDGPVENRPGLRVLFFKDPEGNVLELVEYSDLASYRPDLVKR
jgi:catechol 2,3-dioxygenase-like lactoylglutathione lyase family enzyme